MSHIELPTDAEPVRVVEGDCLDVLYELPDACVDAVITDPPYSSGGFTRGEVPADRHRTRVRAVQRRQPGHAVVGVLVLAVADRVPAGDEAGRLLPAVHRLAATAHDDGRDAGGRVAVARAGVLG